MKNFINQEVVGQCKICHKTLTRDHSNEWYYYNGDIVCTHHSGVEAWYGKLIEQSNQELIDDGVLCTT